jgi:serine/threonine-protein kinase HipA
MDRYAVIWTRAGDHPAKLADMVLTSTELRVTKTDEAIDRALPGVSLLHDLAGQAQFSYARSEGRPLPPQLEILLPPPDHANPQRRILLALMDQHRIELRGLPVAEQHWKMLLFAGRNGIGHLDVFESDDDAQAYYTRTSAAVARPVDASGLWHAFRRFIAHTANEEEENLVMETVGPTPGIAGFAPKLMTSIAVDDDNQWNGDLILNGGLPVIAKIEQANYPGLLALEKLAYDYHDQCGFDVPRTWFKEIDHHGETIPLLAIERFDRKDGQALPQESFYSLLHTGNWNRYRCNTDGSMESISGVFTALNLPAPQKEAWFRRFVMAILTGNGDLHTENMAISGGQGVHCLSPVYDPAPMRAYRGRSSHDILSALPFADIGGVVQETYREYAGSGATPPDLGDRLVQFGTTIGIAKKRAKDSIADLLLATRDYPEEAIACLESVPAHLRKSRAPDIDGFRKTLEECRNALAIVKQQPKTSMTP